MKPASRLISASVAFAMEPAPSAITVAPSFLGGQASIFPEEEAHDTAHHHAEDGVEHAVALDCFHAPVDEARLEEGEDPAHEEPATHHADADESVGEQIADESPGRLRLAEEAKSGHHEQESRDVVAELLQPAIAEAQRRKKQDHGSEKAIIDARHR
mgnify:CR=1 FL=1